MKLVILKDLRFNSLHTQSLSLDFLHVTFGRINSKCGTGPRNSVPLNWDEEGLLSASYKRHVLSVHLNLLCAGMGGNGRDKNPFGFQTQKASRE